MTYQLFPSLSEEEYANLKEDIAARGVMVPVEKDEAGNILDGFNRAQICAELGIQDYPVTLRLGMTHEEKVEHALTMNLARRHLSREARQVLVAKLRSEGWTLSRIAERIGISTMTAQRDVATLPNDKVDFPERIVGEDGKSRPAKMPRTVTAQDEAQAQQVLQVLAEHGLPGNETPSYTAGDVIADARATQGHLGALRREERQEAESRMAPMFSSDTYEWYTPGHIIERARRALDTIEFDPCTSEAANQTVQAQEFYTVADDGLAREWRGATWMNPPYGSTIGDWVRKLRDEFRAGRVTRALALVPARTDTAWFNAVREYPRVFLRGRLKFTGEDADAEGNSAPFPSALIAFGVEPQVLGDVFGDIGDVYQLVEVK